MNAKMLSFTSNVLKVITLGSSGYEKSTYVIVSIFPEQLFSIFLYDLSPMIYKISFSLPFLAITTLPSTNTS